MQKTILPIIALALFGLANAQVNSGGACENPPAQSNFNLSKFMGIWYEYSKYPLELEGDAKCVTILRTQTGETETVGVSSLLDPSTNQTFSIDGTSEMISGGTFANYNSTLPPIWWVVSTDYDSYAVTYSCESADDNSHDTYLWIFTREQKPCAVTIKKAMKAMRSNGLSLAPLTLTDQSNCEAALSDNFA